MHTEFLRGNFMSSKTAISFSATFDDHLRKHNNKVRKGEGAFYAIVDNQNILL